MKRIAIWAFYGVGALAVSLFGRTAWKKMRPTVVGQILKARQKVRQRRSQHLEVRDDPRQLMNPPLAAINFSRMI
jgi:hypothetical protein